jgi:hypothetical protein
MADDLTSSAAGTQQGDSSAVIIPADVQTSFPDILEMIMKSESMNNGERQYWIDILPVMTTEQVQQLREILTNERDQLAAIDAKYATEIQKVGTDKLEQTDEERNRRRMELSSKENVDRSEDTQEAEDILKQMNEES